MLVERPNITAPTSALMLGWLLTKSPITRACEVGLSPLLPATEP